MARYRLDLFDLEDANMLSCSEATCVNMLVLEIENGMFFLNEEQALQLAEHLEQWAKRNEGAQ